MKRSISFAVLVVVACGGMIEPPPPTACETDVGPVRGDLVIFEPLDGGGTEGNSSRECPVGARCVAFVDGIPRQGVCR